MSAAIAANWLLIVCALLLLLAALIIGLLIVRSRSLDKQLDRARYLVDLRAEAERAEVQQRLWGSGGGR